MCCSSYVGVLYLCFHLFCKVWVIWLCVSAFCVCICAYVHSKCVIWFCIDLNIFGICFFRLCLLYLYFWLVIGEHIFLFEFLTKFYALFMSYDCVLVLLCLCLCLFYGECVILFCTCLNFFGLCFYIIVSLSIFCSCISILCLAKTIIIEFFFTTNYFW